MFSVKSVLYIDRYTNQIEYLNFLLPLAVLKCRSIFAVCDWNMKRDESKNDCRRLIHHLLLYLVYLMLLSKQIYDKNTHCIDFF